MRKLLSLLASLAMLTTMSSFYTEGTKNEYGDSNLTTDGTDTINSAAKECCIYCCEECKDFNFSAELGEGSDITQLRFVSTDYTTAYSVKDGVKTPIESIVCCGERRAAYVTDLDYINVELNGEYNKYKHFVYENSNRVIGIELNDTTNETYADFRGTIDIRDNKVDVINKGDKPFGFDIWLEMEEGTYNFPPYCRWSVWGDVENNFNVEITDNGILLNSDDKIEMTLYAERYITDKNGKIQYGEYGPLIGHALACESPAEKDLLVTLDDVQKVLFYVDENNNENKNLNLSDDNYYHISSPNSVLVTVNEEREIVCYIDDNSDGVFDTPVVKGDANYDGAINSADASTILAHYAKASTSSSRINTDIFTMDFNDDSYVNSADASAILEYYAKIQTN